MKQEINNKGITLIALIITIIILLVLSVVTITSISNSNIPKNAKDAKNKYTFAEEKEKVILAVQEAILDGRGTVAKNGIEGGMNSQFTSTGWQKVNWDDSEDYVRTLITASSRQYKIKLNTGEVEYEKYPGLNVGDKINYTVAGYTGEWRVIDISEENVKIIATSNVENLTISGDDWDNDTNSYSKAEEKLDDICSNYVNEKFATQGKSVRIEDIDQITGFDKKTKLEGSTFQYNDTVTFSFNNGNEIVYTVNGSTDVKESGYTTFKTPLSETNISTPYTVINTGYAYTVDMMDKTTNTYKMLFGEETYWLASSFIGISDNEVHCLFGLNTVRVGIGDGNGEGIGSLLWGVLWDACIGKSYSAKYGVRPVITLKSDVKLTQTSENSGEWNIDI